MRIITRIEVIDVREDDIYRMYARDIQPMVTPISSDKVDLRPININTVNITGRRFYRDGKCIVIGWHPGVEELLEFPLDALYGVDERVKNSYLDGFTKGKNVIWDFLKIDGPDTNYWWLPIPLFLILALFLM